VIVETCAESFSVAEWARTAGHEVIVVPATLVRALGVGSPGLKSDVRDARTLSEGASHTAAIRALAFKWIRNLYCCWIDRTA
jgi:hypothetical protein